jgi:hypothetical protein
MEEVKPALLQNTSVSIQVKGIAGARISAPRYPSVKKVDTSLFTGLNVKLGE